jgi:hypothetical protein
MKKLKRTEEKANLKLNHKTKLEVKENRSKDRRRGQKEV